MRKPQPLEAKLAGVELELADPVQWQELLEEYKDNRRVSAILSLAERWAKLMQVQMAAGKKLPDIAADAMHTADVDRCTADMTEKAGRVLVATWKHGEDLRKWSLTR